MHIGRHFGRTHLTFHVGHSVPILFAGLTVVGLAGVSLRSFLVCVLDAVSAAVIVIPPALAGIWLVSFFRLGRLPMRWHLLIGAALGLGLTSLLILLLGLAGVFHRIVWISLLGLFTVVGVFGLRSLPARTTDEQGDARGTGDQTRRGALSWYWLLLVPFLILALLAAANAPGFIWAEEGQGYDVLEYHLQMPKEYLAAGRIAYAPHNVYANFPMNIEMLYLLGMIVHNEIYDWGTAANMIHLLFGILTVYAVWVAGKEWSPIAGIVSALAVGTVGWLGYLSGLAYVENGLLFFSATAVAALLRAMAQPALGVSLKWLAFSGVCSGFACGCKYTAIPFTAFTILLVTAIGFGGAWRRRILGLSVYLLATAATFAPWLIKNELMTGNPLFPLANGTFRAYPPGWGEKESERWDRGHALAQADRDLGARLRALWRHVPADADQRFGPPIILLALCGLLGRRLEKVDLLLLAMLAIQAIVWLYATHLYARFSVPFLIPLSLLAGRAIVTAGTRRRTWIVGSALLVGTAWNFTYAARLNAREAPGGAPASLIYDGSLPGLEYYSVINHELPANAKVLMLGEARAFYFQREVDYCVVFNRNSFVEFVENAKNADQIMQWLRDRGYTHVLVHWHEIARLTRTYGFSAYITSDLFDRLMTIGLRRMREFHHPEVKGRWVELYEVH